MESTPLVRRFVRRTGVAVATGIVTFFSMLLSVGLAVVLDLLFQRPVSAGDMLIAMIIPAIVAPLMTSGLIRLSHQLAVAEERLRVLAAEDDLTKTFNRRHFFQMAEIEWERSRRHARPLALLILDVDNFKAVNDRYGHVAGDGLLRSIAKQCRLCLRKTDLLGRFGGDEFVILLSETDVDGATETAERIRRAIEATSVEISGMDIRITASVGLASLSSESPSVDALLAGADAALYAAKKKGRNRVEVAPSSSI
jgi:diguanylate cyclase (GGDEF)-like protein